MEGKSDDMRDSRPRKIEDMAELNGFGGNDGMRFVAFFFEKEREMALSIYL